MVCVSRGMMVWEISIMNTLRRGDEGYKKCAFGLGGVEA